MCLDKDILLYNITSNKIIKSFSLTNVPKSKSVIGKYRGVRCYLINKDYFTYEYNNKLYSYNIQTDKEELLKDFKRAIYFYSFDKQKKTIALEFARSNIEVYSYPSFKKQASFIGMEPLLSPKGDKVVFRNCGAYRSAYVYDLNNYKTTCIFKAIKPKGKSIEFLGVSSLFILNDKEVFAGLRGQGGFFRQGHLFLKSRGEDRILTIP